MLADIMQQINKRHGRQAFGLIVVLTVWALIVQPNLSASIEAHRQAVELSANTREAAALMRDTARWLAVATSGQHAARSMP